MSKELKVSDQFRTNPLSTEPGGAEVKIQITSGKIYVYDKIKNVRAYISKLKWKEEITAVWVDNNELSSWR